MVKYEDIMEVVSTSEIDGYEKNCCGCTNLEQDIGNWLSMNNILKGCISKKLTKYQESIG